MYYNIMIPFILLPNKYKGKIDNNENMTLIGFPMMSIWVLSWTILHHLICCLMVVHKGPDYRVRSGLASVL